MTENSFDIYEENTPDLAVFSQYAMEISKEFERDCRRFNRAFSEEREAVL